MRVKQTAFQRALAGLKIIEQKTPQAALHVEYDIIYVKDGSPPTDEDAKAMTALRWLWNEEYGGWMFPT